MDKPIAPTPDKISAKTADGTLLALLVAAFYVLFTLLPGSSTLMLMWPWVFLWQVTLTLPVLWLLWQLWHKPLSAFALGHGLDWVALLTVVGLGISSLSAEFPVQARWHTWAALAGLAALYALRGWLTSANRSQTLLRFQGYVAIVFMILSLGLWITQIYWPELQRLQTLQQYGADVTFSFRLTSLRNWQPIGHQNYVAGYLALVIPLCVGLTINDRGWQRWLWAAGVALGLGTLYTTSSRGGWIALAMTGSVAVLIALLYSHVSRRLVMAMGAGTLALIGVAIISNNRLRMFLGNMAQGNVASSELAYRLITNTVGWQMGRQHPLAGVGPGSVPLVYQQYRPAWAGREAELQFQLHSTPAQLWGELGVWGVLLPLALIVLLGIMVIRWVRQEPGKTASGLPPILVWSLLAGLLAFGLMALTDYQLDIIGIAGVLCVYLAVISQTLSPQTGLAAAGPMAEFPRANRALALVGLGLTLAMSIWVIPIHRAWAISSAGFSALTAREPDLNAFVADLEEAHRLAPWQPYYPYQLGYNLGNLSYRITDNPPLRQTLLTDAIDWFEVGNQIVPYQEFGHSNLGWLQLENQQPDLAQESFARSTALVPAKPGVFFGLGFSCWQAGDTDCAVDAMALEIIRHPALLTSPIWRGGSLADLYPAVTERLEQHYSELLAAYPDHPSLTPFLHQARGTLRWWIDDLDGAAQDWQAHGTEVHLALLALARGQAVTIDSLPETPAKYAIAAWQTPDQRQSLLETAWVTRQEDLPQLSEALPPADTIQDLVVSQNNAESFDDWLKRTAPSWEPRNNRLGFGVLSRQIDGPLPSDFYPRVENIPVVQFLTTVFVSPAYLPALDQALQPHRDQLRNQVLAE